MKKPLLNISDVHNAIQRQSKQKRRDRDLGVTRTESSTIFSLSYEVSKLQNMTMEIWFNNPTISYSLPSQHFHGFKNLLPSRYHEWRCRISREKSAKKMNSSLSMGSLISRSKILVVTILALRVLQKLTNVVPIMPLHASDKRLLPSRNKEGRKMLVQ